MEQAPPTDHLLRPRVLPCPRLGFGEGCDNQDGGTEECGGGVLQGEEVTLLLII